MTTPNATASPRTTQTSTGRTRLHRATLARAPRRQTSHARRSLWPWRRGGRTWTSAVSHQAAGGRGGLDIASGHAGEAGETWGRRREKPTRHGGERERPTQARGGVGRRATLGGGGRAGGRS